MKAVSQQAVDDRDPKESAVLEGNRRRRWAWAVFGLALAIRLSNWAFIGTQVSPDGQTYRVGCNVLWNNPGQFWDYFGIQYAGFVATLCSFLAVPGTSITAWVGLQVVLSAATCALVYLVGSRTIGTLGGLAAALLLLPLWDLFQWDAYLLSEPLFVFLLCFIVWAMAARRDSGTRWVRWTMPLAMVLLATTRPFGIPILLGWFLYDLALRSRWSRIGLLDSRVKAAIVVTVLLAAMFVGANNPFLQGRGFGSTWVDGMVMDDYSAYDHDYEPRPAATSLGFVLLNLDHFMIIFASRIGVFFVPVTLRFSMMHNVLNLLTVLPILAGGLLGMAHLVRRRPHLARVWVTPVCVMVLMVGATFMDYDWRYRAPAYPFFALAAGSYIAHLVAKSPAVLRRLPASLRSGIEPTDFTTPSRTPVEALPMPAEASQSGEAKPGT